MACFYVTRYFTPTHSFSSFFLIEIRKVSWGSKKRESEGNRANGEDHGDFRARVCPSFFII